MRLRPSLIGLLAVLVTPPALARDERHDVAVSATRLDAAVRALGRQTQTSIGFRDRRLAALRVRAVDGDMTAVEALSHMLAGSGARARQVASGSFLIEAAPIPAPPRPTHSASPVPLPAPPVLPPLEPVEIIVTATKRDVPLSAYPGMVHVIEGDDVSTASGRRGTDALDATGASVVSTHLGPGRNKLFIRGIADSSFVGPTQSTVGQYWGNSRITYATPDPSLRLYDVGRIEILEGPQGTLYGAGSLGGVMRVVPREPRMDELSGTVWAGAEAVAHGQPGFDGGAVLNVPLVEDRLALRAVAFGSAENGYIDDVGRGLADVNDVDAYGGRLSLRYADEDGLIIDGSLVGQRIDGADSQYAERQFGELHRSSGAAQPFRNDFLLGDVVVRKSWDDLELTASLGVADQYVFERFEGAALSDPADSRVQPVLGGPQAIFTQANRGRMYTGELRLARNQPGGTGWLIAASALSNRASVERRMELGPDLGEPLTGVENSVEEATIYGEISVPLTATLHTTLGGRATVSRLSGSAVTPVLPSMVFANDPGADNSRTETELLPSAALAWQPNANWTVFARYQEGFRPGGIAVRREFVERFEGDSVHTFEGGARFRSETVELETSATYTDWRNIQADLIDGFGFPATTNIGDGRVFSLGLSGRWRPARGLELDASAYFNDSHVTRQDTALLQSADLAGNTGQPHTLNTERLPNIADVIAHVGISWWTPLSDSLDFELSAHTRYVGQSVLGIGALLGRLQGDYVDTGIEAQLREGDIRYSLALNNLLDSAGNRFALGSPFQIRQGEQITPLKPFTVRLGVELDF